MEQVAVLIVGAGLAGLMAAGRLATASLRVLDKAGQVGGRLATQRIGPGWADHGAQFFTVRSPEFAAFVAEWQAQGLVFVWSQGWGGGSLGGAVVDDHPRYAVRGGMAALAKYLAAGLAVRTGVRVSGVTAVGSGWRVVAEDGSLFQADKLLLTPPVPQSLALLDAGGTVLQAEDRAALERIRYAACVCGLFWVEGGRPFPEPGAIQQPETAVSWLADNQRKGISPAARLITVHAGPAFSQTLWPLAENEALARLWAGLAGHLGAEGRLQEAQLKRWRYALPLVLHSARYLQAQGLPPLLFAGDAFNGPRVEGAALSGLAAAAALNG